MYYAAYYPRTDFSSSLTLLSISYHYYDTNLFRRISQLSQKVIETP